MEDREVIINRIRKLLSLGEGSACADEAESAVLMAQRLIVKYDISDGEMSDGERSRKAIIEVSTKPLMNARTWRWSLADAIASAFRCKVWEQPNCVRPNPCGRSYNHPSMVFYGYPQDASAAQLAFDYLYRTGERLAKKQVRSLKRAGRPVHGAYNSYVTGFLMGLCTELERQSRELMVVMPLAVSQEYDSVVAERLVSVKRMKLSCDHRRAGLIERGRRDGRNAIRSRRLEDAHDFSLSE